VSIVVQNRLCNEFGPFSDFAATGKGVIREGTANLRPSRRDFSREKINLRFSADRN
jgi:hypothetical protein